MISMIAELLEIFEKFGTVTSAKVGIDRETGKSRALDLWKCQTLMRQKKQSKD
jgi:hypothetical protein